MAVVAVVAKAPCASFARLSIGNCALSPSSSSRSLNNIRQIVAVGPLRSSGFLSTPLSIPAGRSACEVVRRRVLVRAMAPKVAPPKVKKKESSAKKRDRVAEQRRIYNKSRKTEIKTRMKKVFLALDALKKKGAESPEEIKPIEVLISQAYKIIDKSVKVGILHRNTGGNRKSRLGRAKKALEIQFGWYTPASTS